MVEDILKFTPMIFPGHSCTISADSVYLSHAQLPKGDEGVRAAIPLPLFWQSLQPQGRHTCEQNSVRSVLGLSQSVHRKRNQNMVGTGLPNFLEGEARLTEKPRRFFFFWGFIVYRTFVVLREK